MKFSLSAAIVAGALLLGLTPSWAKTAKECNAEYSANKAAIKAAQKKADFIAACRAGTEVIPGTAATQAAPAPTQTTAPAPVTPAAPAPIPKPARVTRTTPPATSVPTAANQFTKEGQAEGHCPGATVVWVNTKSRVYHFAGTKDFGNTKAGAYMCEADATAAGDRASKKEKHP